MRKLPPLLILIALVPLVGLKWPLLQQMYCWLSLALFNPAGAETPGSADGGTSGSAGGSRRQIQGVEWAVIPVDLRRQRLHLIGQAAGEPHGFDGLDAWAAREGVRVTAAMNAAIFETIYQPTGLWIERGQRYQPLNVQQGRGNFFLSPNGVFSLEEGGAGAHIRSSAEVAELIAADPAWESRQALAMQSGPLLLRAGTLHPRLLPGSDSRCRRNGIGLIDDNLAVLLYTDTPVNLHQMASAFTALGATDALYLDGTISGLCGGKGCAGGLWAGMVVVTE